MTQESVPLSAENDSIRSICVTGTNGKTSTTSMIASIVESSGQPAAKLTTLGYEVDGQAIDSSSPDAFNEAIRLAVSRGVKTIAIETTSRALALGFANVWPADVAIFTNLTHDHLDYHPSIEHYLASKSQLFLRLKQGGTAIFNCADEASSLIDEVTPLTARRLGYSAETVVQTCAHIPLVLQAERIEVARFGTRVTLRDSELAKQLGGQFQIALIGKVFGENALAAIVAAYSLGYSPSHIHAGLQRIKSICGRFEVVERAPLTVVDYAHTPDALFRTLTQARELLRSGARKTARLICVFGCGGNKDASKRGPMGKIAGELADVVVITTDNPREEPPERIASAILAGARQTAARIVDQPDRKRAIEMAMNIATPLDVIVIAGKGHETLQRIGDQVLEFSDRETARQAYAGRVTE